jgi:hypothetical protein
VIAKAWKWLVLAALVVAGIVAVACSPAGGARLQAYLRKRRGLEEKDEAADDKALEQLAGDVRKANDEVRDASKPDSVVDTLSRPGKR